MTRRSLRFTADNPVPRVPSTEEQLAGTMFDAPAPVRRDAPDTSREAADALSEGDRVRHLRLAVLAAFDNAPGGLTPDECAEILQESVLSIRPRCTEYLSETWCRRWLNLPAQLYRTGDRRRNASGCAAHVLARTTKRGPND